MIKNPFKTKDNLNCLICSKKCGKNYTTFQYKYEGGKIGETYVCEKCSKQYDVEEMKPDEQPI